MVRQLVSQGLGGHSSFPRANEGCPSAERGMRGGRVERGGSKGGSEARFARLKFLMSGNIVECGG